MKRNRHFVNSIMTAFLVLILTAEGISGCGANEEAAISEEEIELVDPVGVAMVYDVAGYKTLYDAEVYSCLCEPAVTEYQYLSDAPFEKYGRSPGEVVSEGDVVVYGSNDEISERIEELEESIEKKARDFSDSMGNLAEDLYDAKKAEYKAASKAQEAFNEMADSVKRPLEQAAKNAYDRGEEFDAYFDVTQFEKEDWVLAAMHPLEEGTARAKMNRENIEQNIKEQEELFALEAEYDEGCLERLKGKINSANIVASKEGVVVGINMYYAGDAIPKNTSVIAVGDTSSKTVHTEYIGKSVINKAKDVYALVNGKRYEVTPVLMEKEEYNRLKKQNDEVYSTFYIDDPNDEIKFGDFVTLVLLKDSRVNALCVLSEAVKNEGMDHYVYMYTEDGSTVTRAVTIGLKDGIYTEIVSGLEEGEKVLTNSAVNTKGRTAKLEKGSVSGSFKTMGFLYYPSSEWITNPAKTGTAYIKEILVENYQPVTKGQEVAKIEIISDAIETQRISRKIQRQQERLVRLMQKKSEKEKKAEEVERSLDRAIKSRERAIEDLTKELEKSNRYSGVISLTAPYDGIVTAVTTLKAGDLISYKENIVQMADQSLCYIVFEDKDGQVSYGNEANITYQGDNNIKKEVKGTVAMVDSKALGKDLHTGVNLISLSSEDIFDMAQHGSSIEADGWWRRSSFDVNIKIREVNDVVVVPKSAVMTKGNYSYVKVKTEDGRAEYVPFISGGSDTNHYWVADGLSEGMEICLE